MCDCNFVIGVSAINQCEEKVLEGTGEVVQPTTVYASTGQGSQEQGIVTDLAYNAYLFHFGGIKGQAIRECYMEMIYDMTDNNGNINLFLQISVSTRFNTCSRIQKDFFSPLNSCKSPLLLRYTQPSKTCVQKV